MEPNRVRGSRVVFAGLLIVLVITAFVLLRMMQSGGRAPVTAPPHPDTPADSTR